LSPNLKFKSNFLRVSAYGTLQPKFSVYYVGENDVKDKGFNYKFLNYKIEELIIIIIRIGAVTTGNWQTILAIR